MIDALPINYLPGCREHCPLVPYCKARALAAGDPSVLDPRYREVLAPAGTLGRAYALLDGTVTAERSPEAQELADRLHAARRLERGGLAMSDLMSLVQCMEALRRGRAVRITSHRHVAIQPHALVLAPLVLAGEDTAVHILALGGLGQPARIRYVADPRQRDDLNTRLVAWLSHRLERYYAQCLADGTYPQLWVSSGAGARLLDVLPDRLRAGPRHPRGPAPGAPARLPEPAAAVPGPANAADRDRGAAPAPGHRPASGRGRAPGRAPHLDLSAHRRCHPGRRRARRVAALGHQDRPGLGPHAARGAAGGVHPGSPHQGACPRARRARMPLAPPSCPSCSPSMPPSSAPSACSRRCPR
ncbi:MAG TPA: hypothetical protein VKF37_18495 [Chloroflexota bacterium]|nr:hypothetical protein [Chloroflexota bacterium]